MAASSDAQETPLGSGELAHTADLPPSAVGTLGPLNPLEDPLGATTQALASATVPLVAGRRLASRYELIEPIARGGYGNVWRARHVQIGREFAIKVLLDGRRASQDPDALIKEAQRVSALEHANIVNMIDVGFVEPGRPFAVMELLVGRPLRAELTGTPSSWTHARSWALQTLAGLAFAHDAGVVHGDITPNNIFLDSKNDTAKLIDFGLAQSDAGAGADDAATVREVRGTPAYMSPEQLRGERVSRRSDLYSFGCVLFEALTGRPPFRGTQNEIVVAHLERAAPRETFPASVPSAVARAILRCLRKSPDARPASAQELAETLAHASHAPSGTPSRPRRHHPWLAPVASAAAVLATLTAVVGLVGAPQPRQPLRPVALTVPAVTAATPSPALSTALPVLEVAVPRIQSAPIARPQARRRRATPPAPVLHTHPTGVTNATAAVDKAAQQPIAHLDGLKNPFANHGVAATTP